MPPSHRAAIIIEALPFIRAFAGKTVVVKYGGNAMVDPALTTAVMQDLILMRLCASSGCCPSWCTGAGRRSTRR
jgi:acetylglutamate kinase